MVLSAGCRFPGTKLTALSWRAHGFLLPAAGLAASLPVPASAGSPWDLTAALQDFEGLRILAKAFQLLKASHPKRVTAPRWAPTQAKESCGTPEPPVLPSGKAAAKRPLPGGEEDAAAAESGVMSPDGDTGTEGSSYAGTCGSLLISLHHS